MSYFQGNFQGAGVPMTDARQTRMFIDRMREQEKQRKDQAKALAEDQKRMSMIAQGFGLEKGEVDSMSRGELQGFIENKSMQVAQEKAQQEHILNLQKFASEAEARKINADAQRMMAKNQKKMLRVNRNNTFLKNLEEQNKRLREKNTANEIRANISEASRILGDPNASDQEKLNANRFITKYPDLDPDYDDSTLLSMIKGNRSSAQPYDNLSPAQKKIDEENAKKLVGFKPVLAEMNIKKIREAIDLLNQGAEYDSEGNFLKDDEKLTGNFVSFLPDTLRNIFDKEGFALQQAVESVIQMDLKQTLGAQFTEKEGRMFLDRGFNPKMSDRFNVEKLKTLLGQLEGTMDEYDQLHNYFYNVAPKKFGGMNTFQGFKYEPRSGFSMNNNQTRPLQTNSGNRFGVTIPGAKVSVVDSNATR
tara:strand:+ start:426 stop:1682 length:1257 start_codon:yes stop_codon:yes gene_type:complete